MKSAANKWKHKKEIPIWQRKQQQKLHQLSKGKSKKKENKNQVKQDI